MKCLYMSCSLGLFLLFVHIFQSSHAGVMFGLKKEYLFSEVEGQLLRKGVPLENVVIRQMCSGDDQKDMIFETRTGKKGMFRFGEVTQPSRFHGPFDPFSAPQILAAVMDGEEEELWINVKRSTKERSESDGKPLILVCDLDSPMKESEDSTLSRVTRCSIVSNIGEEP